MLPRLYEKRFRVCFCCGMLLFALLVRFAAAPERMQVLWQRVAAFLADGRVLNTVLFLETGVRAPAGQTSPAAAPLETTAIPSETQTETVPETTDSAAAPGETTELRTQLVFSAQEADEIGFRGNCTYQVDKAALLLQPLSWTTPETAPQVLIIHTHTSEAYTSSEGFEYESQGNYRTLDETRNMLAVGDALTDTLTAAGIGVVHDRQFHDQPSYDNSYAEAKRAIEAYLAQYPSIVMVLDIHRDAAENEDGTQMCETVELNGDRCAQLMLVVGTDEGGLTHPAWRENLSCALKLQALTNRLAPGLCKRISLRTERFNQHETPASLLVEVGAAGNTLPQALRAVRYLGAAVSELLLANRD